MTARRRRGGSESEQAPFIVTSGGLYSSQDSWPSSSVGNGMHNHGVQLNESPLKHSRETLKEIQNMTARDRTTEFANAIRSLQGRHVARAAAVRDPRKAKYIQSYAEFMMIARTIGKNISSTYAKLEKLTLLAKRKSLFNDHPVEIQELTYMIKEDLSSLNQQIAKLQDLAKNQRHSQENGRHLLSHSSSVVLALQSKL